MKLTRFTAECTQGQPRIGIVEGDAITVADGSIFNTLTPTETKCRIVDVQKFLPPVDPPNILAIGLNYRAHAAESKMELPREPVLFVKATTSLCGHKDNIILPAMAPDEVDYEAELVIVIGKTAKKVSEGEALDYVFGYTCGNDVSARDCQMRYDRQWARAKSFDTFAPIGPVIETDIDGDGLPIRSRLNGKVMQESNTSDLIFGVRQLVSYLSHAMTLLPGTLIMTGTPSGVGFARNPQAYLRPGDVIEVEIEGIGTLSNTVLADTV